jgi:ergothioneine biosynthesis protein EgtB
MSDRKELIERFISVRKYSAEICSMLETEDYVVQPCSEVSPPKWHLGHTTWFFEELILVKFSKDFSRFNNQFGELFNSYYKSAGKHWLQCDRGNLSRPTVIEVYEYRKYIDEKLSEYFQNTDDNEQANFILEIGINHEQQHQELLYMDIKAILGANPMLPVYSAKPLVKSEKKEDTWKIFKEGVYEIGHQGKEFSYDNEGPKHKTYIHPFSICENTVTNSAFLEFINDGGYEKPNLWLSEGWDWVNNSKIGHPLYWNKSGELWNEFTLHGNLSLDPNSPVTHISYFEADAFANWIGGRLPTEQESEIFLAENNVDLKLSLSDSFHPSKSNLSVNQVWFWTRSQYSPYPGYQTYQGELAEYNGKFMCNQFVLKGGCVATPDLHYRHSYRNFYQANQRWMFSGIRIAKDI